MTHPVVVDAGGLLSKSILHVFAVKCFLINQMQTLKVAPIVFGALNAYAFDDMSMNTITTDKWCFMLGGGRWIVTVADELPPRVAAIASCEETGEVIGHLENVSNYVYYEANLHKPLGYYL